MSRNAAAHAKRQCETTWAGPAGRNDGVVLANGCGVECWIEVVQQDERRIVRLAGRLAEGQVPELLQTCEAPDLVTLDLTEMRSADAAGIDTLNRLGVRGALLVGASAYIRLKLDSAARASVRR